MQTLKKKGLTALIAAILMFSMVFAIIPTASAITLEPTLSELSGPVGTVVTVSGTDATPGLPVEIYWDAVIAWDGTKGYLNRTTALGSGYYECEVTIPNATASTLEPTRKHYIIAYDVKSETSKGAEFTVTPKIVLKPKAGLPEDPVTVTGTGFAATSDAKIYFQAHAALTEELGLATAGANPITPAGSPLDNLPVINGSLVVKAYDVATEELVETFTDNGEGRLIRASDSDTSSIIVYTTGVVALNFEPELADDATIVAGYAYATETDEVKDEDVGIGDALPTLEFYLDHYLIKDGSETIYLSMTDETVTLSGDMSPYTGDLAKTDVKLKSITLTVTALWDTVSYDVVMTDPDGDGDLESTSDKFSAGTIDYATGAISITFDTEPDAPPTEAAADYLYVSDITVTLTPDTGKIVFASTPGDGVEITADYTYYEFYDITPTAGVETTALGFFEDDIIIPDVDYATGIPVTAIDAEGNPAEATFKVGAAITLTPEKGPTGTVITISGRGFRGIKIITIEIEAVKTYSGLEITLVDEAFETELIFPSKVGMTVGSEYTISVSDQGTPDTAEATFTVTGLPKITVSPKYGLPGDPITVEGVNFTQIEDTTVELELNTDPTTLVAELETDANGCFSGTFEVPAVDYADYELTADDGNVTTTASFRVGMVYAVLSPKEGPTGKEVTTTGSGFTGNSKVNGTLGDILVFEDVEVSGGGSFSKKFIVPTVPVGIYSVTIMDEEGLTFEATFNVTATTTLTLTPSAAPVGYTVSIVGDYFSAGSTIEVVLYNATDSWELGTADLPIETGSLETDEDGTFEATFKVPEDLALGDYFINATDPTTFPPDDEKLIRVLEVPFSVVLPYREIRTLLTRYDPGDTVSFYVKATFAFDLEIDIKDPTDYPFKRISLDAGEWVKVNDYYVVPYAKASFILPSDATPGAWNWTAYDVTVPLEPEMVDTDIFTVTGIPPVPPELPAEVSGEETLDSTGAPKTVFALGETVLVSAEVTNIGIESQPMLIVVQLMDPDLRALAPSYISVTLDPGDSLTPSLGFIIPPTGYAIGEWTAKIMVLDTWPALGGVPIAEPVTVTFTVTS